MSGAGDLGRDERLRRVRSEALRAAQTAAIRALLTAAFRRGGEERFSEEDWTHALGGVHFVLEDRRGVLAHAAVVERRLRVDGRPLRAGYVEAVATAPGHQRGGRGSRLMTAVSRYIRTRFELGALSTRRRSFYERLGWSLWLGPSSVETPGGPRLTPEDDGGILFLCTRTSPALDPSASLTCGWRAGDVW